MNPDKLFDYLQGRLPAADRAALEERLSSDKQLQRELAVAQQIYAGMRGDSREILQSPRPGLTEQGRGRRRRLQQPPRVQQRSRGQHSRLQSRRRALLCTSSRRRQNRIDWERLLQSK